MKPDSLTIKVEADTSQIDEALTKLERRQRRMLHVVPRSWLAAVAAFSGVSGYLIGWWLPL